MQLWHKIRGYFLFGRSVFYVVIFLWFVNFYPVSLPASLILMSFVCLAVDRRTGMNLRRLFRPFLPTVLTALECSGTRRLPLWNERFETIRLKLNDYNFNCCYTLAKFLSENLTWKWKRFVCQYVTVSMHCVRSCFWMEFLMVQEYQHHAMVWECPA